MCGSSTPFIDQLLAEDPVAVETLATIEALPTDGMPSGAEAFDDLMSGLTVDDYRGLAVIVFGQASHTIEEVDVDRAIYAGYVLDPVSGRQTGERQLQTLHGLVGALLAGVADVGTIEFTEAG